MSSAPHPGRAPSVRGFTLIELMVAVAITAVIAAIALPAYQNSVRKGRRADAMSAIGAIQQAQERWRGNNPSYSTSLTDLRVTEPANYSLTISAPDPGAVLTPPGTLNTGYIIVAEGRAAQEADAACKRMSVRLVNGNLNYAACTSCTSFTYATSNPCFSR